MALKNKHVLIVDDTEDVRVLTKRILENIGIVVTSVASVDDAIEKITKNIPHIIILDLDMPIKSGFDFLSMRSQMPNLKQVPVIVVSGLRDKASIHRALSLGADDYILNPINSTILIQRIRKHLRTIDYMLYTFPKPLPDISLRVKAEIEAIGETSFILASQVRLAKNVPISLSPSKIASVDLGSFVISSAPGYSNRNPSGLYTSKINITGLKETLTKLIKKGGKA